MIPKTIHYCWFGRGEKPRLAKKCIDSWKRFCPDYEIIEWNEDNFDVNCISYVKEAYENKKYAFVTDYVRLYALYTQGGIYMDTDVEVIKPLDDYLDNRAFSGFESEEYVPTGIMGSEASLPIFKELLEDYDNKRFVLEDGSLNFQTNCQYITSILIKHGLILNNSKQIIAGFTLYPSDFFCPYENETGRMNKTENTATIHWFNKSWVDRDKRIVSRITKIFHRIFGVDCFKWLNRLLKRKEF